MPRSTKPWVGKTADSRVPSWLRDHLLEKAEFRCQMCHQPVNAGNPYDVDHVIELRDWTGEGHGNCESNLRILCHKVCHKRKTKLAKQARAANARTRRAVMEHKQSKFRNSRDGPLKTTFYHGTIRRDD